MTSDVTRTDFVGNSRTSFGRFTYGAKNIAVKQWGEGASLSVGAFCSIAENVTVFLGGNHRMDWITTFPFGHIFQNELGNVGLAGHPTTNGDVVIGHDVWIGYGVSIVSGVTIGDGAVLAANATVVRDVGPYEIVAGNPAQLLRKRFDQDIIDRLMALSWWNLPVETIKLMARDLSSPPSADLIDHLIEKYGDQGAV